MKTTVSILLAVAFLPAFGVPRPSPAAAQQGITINEVEPNDFKDRSQVIMLTQGMTTVVRGRAARDDGGSFVDELELDIDVEDDIEDWYVVEVNGVAEFSLEVSWPERADIDAWVFTDISNRVFFDGLTLHTHAATGEKPEVLANRVYYTYSDRDDEADGMLQPLPRTSRYYVAVSNYDPAEWSQPATYEMKITVPGNAVSRRGESVRYDNNGYGHFAKVGPHDLDVDRLMVLERITPPAYPATLEFVNLLQFSSSATGPGPRQELIVLTDPAGTGNPAQATEVLRQKVALPIVEETSAVAFYVGSAGITARSGDIYVGFQVVEENNEFHFPFDVDKAGFRRTFMSTDGGKNYGWLRLASREVEIPFVSNSGITADLLMGNPAPDAARANQPAVSVRPVPVELYTGPVRISVVQ
jgi:hypothetical protein